MADCFITFFLKPQGEKIREVHVRTYGTPSEEQVVALRKKIVLLESPDVPCEASTLIEPYVEGLREYPPVKGLYRAEDSMYGKLNG